MIGICVLGFFLRIILMLSSGHFDLLSNYYFAHQIVYHGDSFHRPARTIGYLSPAYNIHSIWLFSVRGLINHGKDPWLEQWAPKDGTDSNNIEAWRYFVSQQNIHWTLFLLKLPYLFAELLMIVFICKTALLNNSKFKILTFLILNPISLFIIFLCKEWRQRIKLILFGLLPFIFLLSAVCLASKTINLKEIFPNINKVPHADYIYSLAFPFKHIGDKISPFILIYCFVILFALYIEQKKEFNIFMLYVTILMLFFYSFCFFHPQYFLLFIPVIALQISRERRLMSLFYILVFCFFIYTFYWGKDLSWLLFMPLNPQFFASLRPPFEVINGFFPAKDFISIFRSIFSSVSLFMIYFLIKRKTIIAAAEDDAGELSDS